MASVQVERCSIMKEFSPEQRRQFFGFSVNKALHHIDTLYYCVYLNEPEDIVKLQRDDDLPEYLVLFLDFLRSNKDVMRDYTGSAPQFGELEMTLKSFAGYEYCVSLPECFDIFICRILPNADTPRIVVQLRSRYLVLEGVKAAVEKSFSYLREFLGPFGMCPVRVRENRIDYAYHTNLIQNPEKYFDTDLLRSHLKTNLRKWSMFGDTKDFLPDTVNIGTRNSNNVFVRIYNKGREVIEMNYKSFFIERWYQNGLISAFDKYVYEKAYEMRSYRLGLLVGRLKWYIEHGTDEKLLEICHELLGKCYVNSDNPDFIEKKIRNVIPDVTLILNVEFQTKRKFFSTCAEWVAFKTDLPEIFQDKNFGFDSKIAYPHLTDPLLKELFGILFSSKDILEYLTGYGNCVSFVEDNSMSFTAFKEAGETYCNWWGRIRGTPIDYSYSTLMPLYRKYDIGASKEKSRRSLEGQIARLSMLKNNDVSNKSFVEDMADALCDINDNDVVPLFVLNEEKLSAYVDKDGNVDLASLNPRDYSEIRERKSRQLRGILENKTKNKGPATEVVGERKI